MQDFEYTREEIVDNYDQLIEQAKAYQELTDTQPELMPLQGVTLDQKYTYLSAVSIVNISYIKYIDGLHNTFTLNPTLFKIIRIFPKRFIVQGITVNSFAYYDLYMLKDVFQITLVFFDAMMKHYSFTYPINNYNDYYSVDFIKPLKDSYFKNTNNIEKLIYLTIYQYYKELKWDILRHYIIYFPDKVNNYVTKNRYDISLLINTINLVFNSHVLTNKSDYVNLISNWIADYLNWYNDQGKKDILMREKAIEVFNKYDVDMYKTKLKDGYNITTPIIMMIQHNYHYIASYGIYEVIKAYYHVGIEDLIKQLYYTLAQFYMSEEDLDEDAKRKLLYYLDNADDYSDAKELKKRLLYSYIGLDLGQSYDIDIDEPNTSTLYDLIKIIKNNCK